MCKVSIIVPVYNVMHFLDRCVKSLVSQTLHEIEIVLVDDGSTDESSQLCDKWSKLDSRIKVVHKKNAGLGFARNTGLENVSGEYVAFVDSDDYVTPNAFEILYNIAIQFDADAVYSHSFIQVKDGKVIYPRVTQKDDLVFEGANIIKLITLRMFGGRTTEANVPDLGYSACKTLYKRKCIEDNFVRFVSEREFISEDAIYQIDFLSHAYRVVRSPMCYYYYCYNSSSLTHKYHKGRFERDVSYCKEVKRKLSSIADKEDVEHAMNIYLFERARDTMSYVVHNSSECVNAELADICGNNELRDAIVKIPKRLLSNKEKLFLFCIRHNCFIIIRLYFTFTSLLN